MQNTSTNNPNNKIIPILPELTHVRPSSASTSTDQSHPVSPSASSVIEMPSLQGTEVQPQDQPISQNNVVIRVSSFRQGLNLIFDPFKKFFNNMGGHCQNNLKNLKYYICNWVSIYIFYFLISFSLVISTLIVNKGLNIDQAATNLETFISRQRLEPIMSIKSGAECHGHSDPLGHWPGAPGFESFPFNHWKSTKSYCIERAIEDVDYYLTTSGCYQGGKQCFPGYCFYGNECPITSLLLKDVNVTGDIKFGDKEFDFVRELGSQPLTDIGVSYYSLPCELNERGPDPRKDASNFLNGPVGQCNSRLLDLSTFVIDSGKENQLLALNKASKHAAFPEGYKKVSKKVDVVLYGRTKEEIIPSESCMNLDENVLFAAVEGMRSLKTANGDAFGQFALVNFISLTELILIPIHIIFMAVSTIVWPILSAGYISNIDDVFKAREYLAELKPCYNSDSYDIFVDYFTQEANSLIPVRGLYVSLISFSAIALAWLTAYACRKWKKNC